MRIVLFNQANLPSPVPLLQSLLSLDCYADVIVNFEMNEPVDSVSFCEAVNKIRSMLKPAADQIAGDANVKRSTDLTCKNIDKILMLLAHQSPEDWIARLRGR